MHPITALQSLHAISMAHTRRNGEFRLPSVQYPGHEITVRRLDENSRPATEDDLRFLTRADVAPGSSAVLTNHAGKPGNRFIVYMSVEAKPTDIWEPARPRPLSQ